MLPWSFSEEAAAEKHMAQLQHNMWVTNSRAAALSIITGGGKWIEIKITCRFSLPTSCFDRRKEILALRGERRAPPPVWCRAAAGPHRGGADRGHELVKCLGRILNVFRHTRDAYLQHEKAKAELKSLIPEDAKEAIGHGIRAKRSKAGAVSFDLLDTEAARATVQ